MRHLNDNRAYPPQRRGFWRIGACMANTYPFSICHLPGALYIHHRPLFEHSRCFGHDTKGADGATDLLEVLRNSPLEKLDFTYSLLSNSVRCVAEAARCQLDQFERSKLLSVPRFANLVAMFGQFVETACFFFRILIKGHCHGCFFDTVWQHWKTKNVK